MNIDTIENLVMLLAAVVGLLSCLFHYIDKPKRGWLYLTIFFLMHLLSDYYWTVYTIVMQDDPAVSAFMAYLGWNVGYLLLLLAVFEMRDPGSKRYFNPLMLLPIPLNIAQFIIYLPYGGILNNVWQETITTIIACLCLQSLLYWLKNRKNGAKFPRFHLLALLFITTEYGMWTASCFDWPGIALDPYYYCAFANYLIMIFFGLAVAKDYEARGISYPEKTASELKLQMILRLVTTGIIIGCCLGGYFLASWMKSILPEGSEDSGIHSFITVTLFIISVFLVILILGVVLVITFRYRNRQEKPEKTVETSRRRFGAIMIVLATVILMAFSVGYTSKLFYQVSVSGVMDSGEDTAERVATELKTYLSDATSTLEVAADAVGFMIRNGEPQEKIERYIQYQTQEQKSVLDENFTGLYALSRGEYLDGLGWVPPDDYKPTSRDWYREAVRGGGRIVIIPPYVDAQTQSVVITICKRLPDEGKDGKYNTHDVVALDVIVNYIQEVAEDVDINGKGTTMIVSRDGVIIAHHDPALSGADVSEVYGKDFLDLVLETGNGTAETNLNGEDCTLFVSDVMEQWYIVIEVSDNELYEEVSSQLTISIAVSILIFALLSFFYYLGTKNEQAYSRELEEMRVDQQRQEYESQVLKLEKDTADEANKAKSRFLADMSHEIRTPINAILGMNEMIMRETDSKEIMDYARNIGASGRNLLSLINSILDFSKIEDGKMEIVPVRYSTASLITYLVNSVSERARKKDLELRVNVDPHLPRELYGDDTRINQVVMNLLTNAVKYTREGTVTLNVEELERSEGKALIRFEVRDTGIGIREEDMDKLFQSFERLDVVQNRNIEGTGLGMSIVTNLLTLMDSELNVKSTYGEGSVFSFDIWQKIENEVPLGEYKVMLQDMEEREQDKEYLYAPDAHILVVDDTKMNLTVVCSLLKRTKIRIDTAASGVEAVKLAEQHVYDVILMDQRMPGMDGTEAMKEIRALENKRNENTPVICLTADAIRGAKEKYLAQGFSDYLTKPVNGEELEQVLRENIPKEKIQTKTAAEEEEKAVTEPAEPKTKEPSDPLLAALEKAGVDTEKGMMFCQNDEEIYREVLSEFSNDYETRSESIQSYHDAADWGNYMIYVHSLKSSAKTIGAHRLFELAANLEIASRDEDAALVERDHAEALQLYNEVVTAIRAHLGTSDAEEEADFLVFKPE